VRLEVIIFFFFFFTPVAKQKGTPVSTKSQNKSEARKRAREQREKKKKKKGKKNKIKTKQISAAKPAALPPLNPAPLEDRPAYLPARPSGPRPAPNRPRGTSGRRRHARAAMTSPHIATATARPSAKGKISQSAAIPQAKAPFFFNCIFKILFSCSRD
jgi:hypothetical protein